MKRKILTTAVGAAFAFGSAAAMAANVGIGLDFDGLAGGANFQYSSRWVDLTDTGVDVNPNANGVTFNPGDVHSFHSQHRVGSFLDAAGQPLPFPSTPFGPYQITQTAQFFDMVKSFTPIVGGGGTVVFDFLGDAKTDMTIWLDDVTDGSAAVPGAGPGTVNCYGAGPCGSPDGIAIMAWNLISNVSSFTSSAPGAGTGQFDLVFELTSFNKDYVDPNGINRMRFTGTLAQPLGGIPVPDTMWDGTTWGGPLGVFSPNQIFKIDASKDFFTAVPEPASLALLGLGLAGLGFSRRRKQ